jgi:hypothetical protein
MNESQFSVISAWVHTVAGFKLIAHNVENRVAGFDHAVLTKASHAVAEAEKAAREAFGVKPEAPADDQPNA